MIHQPRPQNTQRGVRPGRPVARTTNGTEHQASLASRLTDRDRWIVHMLHEHRVLTADHITTLAFPSYRSGRQRLRELYQWSVLDRFQPLLAQGAAPMHYVLGPAGATVLAAEYGIDSKDFGYRRDRVNGIAHNQRLAHTVGVSEWFTALIDHAVHSEDTEVSAWWSEARCARHFGDLTRPDAYGRWRHHRQHLEFFLEYDTGTERPAMRLAAKLHGYAQLAASTGILTPLLVWMPTSRRETRARPALHDAWRALDDPRLVPIATAAADLLDPDSEHPSPAEPAWLPLDPAATRGGRRDFTALALTWPYDPPATPTSATTGAAASAAIAPAPPVPASGAIAVPAPDPMPPIPTYSRPARRSPWASNSVSRPSPSSSSSPCSSARSAKDSSTSSSARARTHPPSRSAASAPPVRRTTSTGTAASR